MYMKDTRLTNDEKLLLNHLKQHDYAKPDDFDMNRSGFDIAAVSLKTKKLVDTHDSEEGCEVVFLTDEGIAFLNANPK